MTIDDLVRKLLPDMRPETLRGVVRLTGVRDLPEPDPDEREDVARQLRDLESVRESAGPLKEEQQRLEGHRAALAPLIDRCLSHPRFARLVEAGYGTAGYVGGKEQRRDEQAARELEERCSLPFADLRREVSEALEASLVLKTRLGEVKQRLERSEELEEKCRQLRRWLERWPQAHLETARWKLRRHIEGTPGLLDQLRALS